MGATCWYYVTPYQPDPEIALRQLREETFAAGRYQDPVGAPEEHLRQQYERAGFPANAAECRAAIEEVVHIQQALATGHEEDMRALPRGLRASVRRARALANRFGQG